MRAVFLILLCLAPCHAFARGCEGMWHDGLKPMLERRGITYQMVGEGFVIEAADTTTLNYTAHFVEQIFKKPLVLVEYDRGFDREDAVVVHWAEMFVLFSDKMDVWTLLDMILKDEKARLKGLDAS